VKILLTGSTGLIGSGMLKTAPGDVQIVKLGRGLPFALPRSFDAIIHTEGYAQPIKFLADEIATIKVNTTRVMDLFKYLKDGGKFLYMSSSEVYNGTPPPQTEKMIGTTDPTHPRACYIESKRCGEAICMAYRRMGYDVKIARVSLTYGKTRPDDTRALNHFVEQGKTGKIILMDKGEAKRTYLYVEDGAKMLWDILLKGIHSVYNVGGISKTTIAELAQTIAKITNATVEFGDKGLEGAPEDVGLDINQLLNEFGPREFTSLEDGIRKML
jgi:UDP-glucuronate decarboxylase